MSDAGGTALDRLSDRCGIGRVYLDYRRTRTEIAPGARMAVLAAMGFDATEAGACEALERLDEEMTRALPRTLLLRSGEPLELTLKLPEARTDEDWQLRVDREDATPLELTMPSLHAAPVREVAGRSLRCAELSLAHGCSPGYHRLQLLDGEGESVCDCALLVAPRTSYQPEGLGNGGRLFGLSVQLYSVRSERNWGMGDFSDLARLLRDAAACGVQVLGLNPLHALFPANPLHFSPYSPSNRAFLNVMYLDPEALPNYGECEEARAMVAEPAFQARLAALRSTHHVDYAGVAACKLPVLEALYRQFVDRHLGRSTRLDHGFTDFLAARGEALRLHATYDAIHEHFLRQDLQVWGWPVWPEEYRDPASAAVAEFTVQHADRIRYYQFLQWCASEQLRAAQAVARECGMAVGIYLDLAVGVDLNGSEVWANRRAFCTRASAGAPPDELARSGQDWGFPPLDPRNLVDTAYGLFIDDLRANMAMCGAVRYDHAVSLLRLWWIPKSGGAADGAYVNYPLEDLLGVLALESERNRCLVIGEDLGTVPDELTEVMERNHLYSYRVLYFEKRDGAMIAPADYPREAVATVTTHDLPTLASWWDGSDIEIRAALGLLGDPAMIEEMRASRIRDRQRLLDALMGAGCWDGERDAVAIPRMNLALSVAVHRFLAKSRSGIMLAQIEDAMEMLTPVNIPGTFDNHRNWQRKLRWPLEDLFSRESVTALCSALREERP
jgi:4-alpha-glucanotransferase